MEGGMNLGGKIRREGRRKAGLFQTKSLVKTLTFSCDLSTSSCCRKSVLGKRGKGKRGGNHDPRISLWPAGTGALTVHPADERQRRRRLKKGKKRGKSGLHFPISRGGKWIHYINSSFR